MDSSRTLRGPLASLGSSRQAHQTSMRTSSGQPAPPVPTQPQPTAAPEGAAASRLPVSIQGGSSLVASNGGLLMQGLCPEAAVSPDAASGGCILGLRCERPPASFLEVALGKVRWAVLPVQDSSVEPSGLQLSLLDCARAPTCTPPHSVCPALHLTRSCAAAASWRCPVPSCTG